ncbi:MAG: 3-dehydroquinate synthase [Acidimicrobiia bacterium]
MRCVGVELGKRRYEVVVGPGALAELNLVSGRRRVAVVSEEPVAGLYGEQLLLALRQQGSDAELFLLPGGEAGKTLESIGSLCRAFASWGLLRGDAVVGLGGGVVTDTAGFAASCYHRGVAFVAAPTTLLGQVDAAIGGKTGVNLPEGKNLVGAFHQPIGVLADTSTLLTLAEREYRSGLGEVAKYAVLGDRALAGLLDPSGRRLLLQRHIPFLEEIVARCVKLKSEVVSADELETGGLRATLNLGHTLGHALESAGSYQLLHGEAVAIGLVFAAALAQALGRVGSELVSQVESLAVELGLPVRAPASASATELLGLMRRDKKSRGGLTFVLDGPRGVESVDEPSAEALSAAFRAVGVET